MTEGRTQNRLTTKLIILFGLLIAISCEHSFDPLQENDRYVYSMYGSLDVHADTQWVRVMPIGESLIPTDSTLQKTDVILIRESTGNTTVLKDSLFRFGGNAYVWNYWTTQNLFPDESYIIKATADDGRQSISEISMPSELPIPEIHYVENTERGTITGSSKDALVTVEIRYLVQTIGEMGCAPEREISISHLEDLYIFANGEYHFTVDNKVSIARELGVTPSNYRVNKRDLNIISAGKDWPNLADVNEEETVLPDVISNVENGTGFIAGIARRSVAISPRRPPC